MSEKHDVSYKTSLRRFLDHRKETLIAAGIFLCLTLLIAWPVVANLDSVIVGDDNDISINPWADWWTAKALTDASLSFWETDFLFYPTGVSLRYHSFSHLNTGFSLLLRPLVGAIPAYNLTVLLNYVLIGLSMFHFARYLTGSFAAALLAGLVFAFNPHALYQSSHPVLLTIWPLPWAALYFIRSLREGNRRFALLAAGFVFLATLASTLILLLLLLWLGPVGLYLLAKKEVSNGWRACLAIFVAVSILLSLPVMIPLISASLFGGDLSFIRTQDKIIPADIASFFYPGWFQPWRKGFYIGIIPLTLLIMARHRREARPWYLLLLFAVLFAIGPYPTFGRLPLPIVLPWSFFVTPLLRHSYRMSVILSLALAVLAAFGWLAITERLGSKQRLGLLVIFGALTLIDYVAPAFPFRPLEIPPFYTEILTKVPDDVAIAILPTGRQQDKRYLLYQTFHEHKMTNGVVSRHSDQTLRFTDTAAFLGAGMSQNGEGQMPADVEHSLQALADIGVGYLILEKTTELNVERWRREIARMPFYEDRMILVYATGTSGDR